MRSIRRENDRGIRPRMFSDGHSWSSNKFSCQPRHHHERPSSAMVSREGKDGIPSRSVDYKRNVFTFQKELGVVAAELESPLCNKELRKSSSPVAEQVWRRARVIIQCFESLGAQFEVNRLAIIRIH